MTSRRSPGTSSRSSTATAPDGADRLLDEADERAARFAEPYAGRVAELDGAGLAAAMAELEAIVDRLGRAGSYAMLRFAVDTADPANGALLARVQERGTAIETKLLFFELEWAALDDERAEELLGADGLDTTRHHLRTLRRYRPHLLSEPEEKLLTEKAVTGRDAWTRLFTELTSAIRVELPDGEDEGVAARRRAQPPRLARPRACAAARAEAVTAALEPGLRTRAFVFNTLLHDKAVDDRLRSYPTWIASRNLANEASDESVQALVEAVRAQLRHPAALVPPEGASCSASTGSPTTTAWPSVGRRGGDGRAGTRPATSCSTPSASSRPSSATSRSASSTSAGSTRPCARASAAARSAPTRRPSVHPYVMLNYTSRRRDVLDARPRARPRPARGARDPARAARAAHAADASRDRVGVRRDARLRAPARRGRHARVAAGAAGREHRGLDRHGLPPDGDEPLRGRSSTPRGASEGELQRRAHRRAVGSSRRTRCSATRSRSPTATGCGGPTSRTSSARRATSTPTPTASCSRSSVYRRYLEEGEAFVPRYLELLAAGGSRSPEELAAIAGLDLDDPAFWAQGLDLVRDQLEQAEAAAAEVRAGG